MRNLLIFMLLVAVFVLGNRSCDGFNFTFGGIRGTGPVQTQTRTHADFEAIDLSIPANVEVSVSEQFFVEISAQENLLSEIKTEVSQGALRIFTDKNISSSSPITVKVSAPDFERFSIAGSGDIKVLSDLQSPQMNMKISGSGNISCPNAEFDAIDLDIVGSGDVTLGGIAKEGRINISGSGDVRAKNFQVDNLQVRISGSGTVTADVVTELKAVIAGSGDVFYTGSPVVDSKVSGSGSVKRANHQ